MAQTQQARECLELTKLICRSSHRSQRSRRATFAARLYLLSTTKGYLFSAMLPRLRYNPDALQMRRSGECVQEQPFQNFRVKRLQGIYTKRIQ